jgi:hypothetical protein
MQNIPEKRLAVLVSPVAFTRVKVAAATTGTMGDVIESLVMEHLAPVKGEDVEDKTTSAA